MLVGRTAFWVGWCCCTCVKQSRPLERTLPVIARQKLCSNSTLWHVFVILCGWTYTLRCVYRRQGLHFWCGELDAFPLQLLVHLDDTCEVRNAPERIGPRLQNAKKGVCRRQTRETRTKRSPSFEGVFAPRWFANSKKICTQHQTSQLNLIKKTHVFINLLNSKVKLNIFNIFFWKCQCDSF